MKASAPALSLREQAEAARREAESTRALGDAARADAYQKASELDAAATKLERQAQAEEISTQRRVEAQMLEQQATPIKQARDQVTRDLAAAEGRVKSHRDQLAGLDRDERAQQAEQDRLVSEGAPFEALQPLIQKLRDIRAAEPSIQAALEREGKEVGHLRERQQQLTQQLNDLERQIAARLADADDPLGIKREAEQRRWRREQQQAENQLAAERFNAERLGPIIVGPDGRQYRMQMSVADDGTIGRDLTPA